MAPGVEVVMPSRARYPRTRLQRLGQGPWLVPRPLSWHPLVLLLGGGGLVWLCRTAPVLLPVLWTAGTFLGLALLLGRELARHEMQVCPRCLEACSRGADVCPWCHFAEAS